MLIKALLLAFALASQSEDEAPPPKCKEDTDCKGTPKQVCREGYCKPEKPPKPPKHPPPPT